MNFPPIPNGANYKGPRKLEKHHYPCIIKPRGYFVSYPIICLPQELGPKHCLIGFVMERCHGNWGLLVLGEEICTTELF